MTADVTLRDSSVDALYTSLVQVQLAGTVLGALDTDGRMSGTVRIADNELRAAVLELDGVILDDQRGRFAIYGLDGVVDWRVDKTEKSAASRLSWDSGTAYNLIIGERRGSAATREQRHRAAAAVTTDHHGRGIADQPVGPA